MDKFPGIDDWIIWKPIFRSLGILHTSIMGVLVYIPTNSGLGYPFPTFLPTFIAFVFVLCFDFHIIAIPNGVRWTLIVFLFSFSFLWLISEPQLFFFHFSVGTLYFILWKVPFHVPCSFLYWIIRCFLVSWAFIDLRNYSLSCA